MDRGLGARMDGRETPLPWQLSASHPPISTSLFPLCPLPSLPSPGGSVRLSLVSLRATSQGIATGKYHAAVLTNSAEWEAACVESGRKCGDLVHPLVYCPELHFSEFASAVADMKNSVAVGWSGGPARRSGAGRGLLSGSQRDPRKRQQCRRGSTHEAPTLCSGGTSKGGLHHSLGSLPAHPPIWCCTPRTPGSV